MDKENEIQDENKTGDIPNTPQEENNAPSVEVVKSENINNKFEERAASQVNKILKDLATVSFQGSKSDLTESEIENIISELREITNVTKKQFSMSLEKKDDKKFGVVKQPVTKTVREIKALGDLAEKHSGEFSEEHVKAIFEVLKKKTNELKKELKNKDQAEDGFSF